MAGVLKHASPVGVRTRTDAYGSRAACEEQDSDSTKWSRVLPADASSGAQPEDGPWTRLRPRRPRNREAAADLLGCLKLALHVFQLCKGTVSEAHELTAPAVAQRLPPPQESTGEQCREDARQADLDLRVLCQIFLDYSTGSSGRV